MGVRSGIAALVVSSRAASRPYSRVTTNEARERAKGRLLRNVISSNEGTGAQRIGEFGAPSLEALARGSRCGPHPGAAHQRDCGRGRIFLLFCLTFHRSLYSFINEATPGNRGRAVNKQRRSHLLVLWSKPGSGG